MKTPLLWCSTLLVAANAFAAPEEGAQRTTPSGRLKTAIEALAQAPSYSWRQTMEFPQDATPVVLTGRTERGGFTLTTLDSAYQHTRRVRKGDESATEMQDGHWQTTREAQAIQSKSAGKEIPRATIPLNPAEDLIRLLPQLTDVSASDDVITSKINEAGVAQRFPPGKALRITKIHLATASFWLNQERLAKYELRYHLVVVFLGNVEERNLTLTVMLHDIGTTKVDVPRDALEKFER